MWNAVVEPTRDDEDGPVQGGPAPDERRLAGEGRDPFASSVGDEAPRDPPASGGLGADRGPHDADASAGEAGQDTLDNETTPPDAKSDAPGDAVGGPGTQEPAGRGRRKRKRGLRPHPFAHETSSDVEKELNASTVTLMWLAGATALMVAGLLLSRRYSDWGGQGPPAMESVIDLLAAIFQVDQKGSLLWEQWTLIPLFVGLALLGFGFVRQTWSKRLTMAGWILFGFYWGLTATDLYASEDQDIVNYIFALVGVYFFVYLAYQQWLDLMRGSDTYALHFLNVTAFIAAGTYFLVAKITFLRVWLINVVGAHTKWMLDLFGQGDKANLQFVVDKQDSQGPVTFFYPDYYCEDRSDMIGAYCREQGLVGANEVREYFPEPSGLWETIRYYNADVDGVVPVSIILACTAIQSIMLFVGLFAATKAPLRKKVYASIIVGAIIYVLNLVRNTGIIWMFGQGHASFWLMHNAIGKGGSLIAMIGIAFAVFRWFPEFFDSLVQVLDLPDRDGPIERTLKIGRRRPEAAAALDSGA